LSNNNFPPVYSSPHCRLKFLLEICCYESRYPKNPPKT
jgi:hypothetical protein